MNQFLKFIKWTAIIAGIIALPILLKKKIEDSELRQKNIRYDIDDYISEAGL